MSIVLVGPDWPSKLQLQQALSLLPHERGGGQEVRVSWGVECPGAVNGMRRLNAVEQLSAFHTAGILAPKFTEDVIVAQEWVRSEGAKVFGRRLKHSQGTDIVGAGYRPGGPRWITTRKGNRVVRGTRPERWNRLWLEREWWSKVVEGVVEEWRIHAMRAPSGEYRVIGRAKKVQTEPPTRVQPVRSRKNGWHMVHNLEPSEAIREAGKAAVRACGYDFGGVDVFVLSDGRVGVFEVNSAVGMSDYTSAQYAKAFTKYLPYVTEEV